MILTTDRTSQRYSLRHQNAITLTIACLACCPKGSKESLVEAFSSHKGMLLGSRPPSFSKSASRLGPIIDKGSFFTKCGSTTSDKLALFSSVYDEAQDENLPWRVSDFDEEDFSASWLDVAKTQSIGLRASALIPTLQAAFLITGNTVGAGMMILPDVAAEAGLALTVPMVLGLYSINLISGLLINEVAIKQYEGILSDSKTDTEHDAVPSSFKHLSDATFGEQAGTVISGISVLVNWCVLSFSLMRSGEVLHGIGMDIPGIGNIDPHIISTVYALLLTSGVAVSADSALSIISTLAVAVLFGSFAGLLVPGLAQMHNPVETLMTPAAHAGTVVDALSSAAPIFLMTMIFQNVVPKVSKLLDYDRFQTTAAIAIGSAIPPIMYIAWCFAALGGGVDSSVQTGGPLLTLFSMASIVGSSVGGVMSLSEEIGSTFKKVFENLSSARQGDIRTLPSVLFSVAPPLLAGLLFSQGEAFTSALSCAGSYGSPLLYGVLPAVLLSRQVAKEKGGGSGGNGMSSLGTLSAVALGTVSMSFLAQELATDIASICS